MVRWFLAVVRVVSRGGTGWSSPCASSSRGGTVGVLRWHGGFSQWYGLFLAVVRVGQALVLFLLAVVRVVSRGGTVVSHSDTGGFLRWYGLFKPWC